MRDKTASKALRCSSSFDLVTKMIKILLISALAAIVLTQTPPGFFQGVLGNNQRVDTIHGYQVQYDDAHDLIIFVNNANCYLVDAETDRRWDAIIADEESLHRFTEAVYNQIEDNTRVEHISHSVASERYHSRLETWECAEKQVYQVTYRAED